MSHLASDRVKELRAERDALQAEVKRLRFEKERMYQRALDAEFHAAFGPMDVDERVRALRRLVEVSEAEVERLRSKPCPYCSYPNEPQTP